MKAEIDFSIYCSPIKSFGRVCGGWDVRSDIAEGQVIDIPPAKLRLTIQSVDFTSPDLAVISLSDVVLDSRESALALMNILESACGLFVDVFD